MTSPPRLVAVRPPEYFPRCSVMALVDYVDEFIMADAFPYSRQSYQNRTPVRTPDGRMWLSLPLERASRGRTIDRVRLVQQRFWPGKHWRALVHNYSSTPFFQHYAGDLEALLRRPWPCLADLTVATTQWLVRQLGIRTGIRRIGPEGGSTLEEVTAWFEDQYVALDDTAAHDERVMPPGEVVEFTAVPYAQNFDGFEPDLSALDVLFNWGPEGLHLLRVRRQVRAVHQGGVKLAAGRSVC